MLYLQSLSQIKCFSTFLAYSLPLYSMSSLIVFQEHVKMKRQVQNLAKLGEHTSAPQILPTTSTSYQHEILKTKLLILSGRNYHVLNVNKRMK